MRVFSTISALVAGLQLVHAATASEADSSDPASVEYVSVDDQSTDYASSVSNLLGFSWTPHDVNFAFIAEDVQPDDILGSPIGRIGNNINDGRRRPNFQNDNNRLDEDAEEELIEELEDDLEEQEDEDEFDDEFDDDRRGGRRHRHHRGRGRGPRPEDVPYDVIQDDTESNDFHAGFSATDICRRFDGIGRFVEELAVLAEKVTSVNTRSRRGSGQRRSSGALYVSSPGFSSAPFFPLSLFPLQRPRSWRSL